MYVPFNSGHTQLEYPLKSLQKSAQITEKKRIKICLMKSDKQITLGLILHNYTALKYLWV